MTPQTPTGFVVSGYMDMIKYPYASPEDIGISIHPSQYETVNFFRYENDMWLPCDEVPEKNMGYHIIRRDLSVEHTYEVVE